MIDTQAIRKKILDLALRGKLTEQKSEDGTAEELFQQIQQGTHSPIEAALVGDNEQPYDLPINWVWVQLSSVVRKPIKRGKSPKYSEAGSTLVFAQKCNTKAGKIDISKALKLDELTLPRYSQDDFMLDGDIVINSTGTGTLGRVGIYQDSDNPCHQSIVPDSHVTTVRAASRICSLYLYWCLKKKQPLLEGMGTGSTNQKELSATSLMILPIPLPPLAEQHRIVAKIDALFTLLDTIDTLQSQYQGNLAALKSKLIDAGIQGKLTEQLPEDGTAEELYQQIQQEKAALEKAGKIKKSQPLPPISEEEKPFDIPDSWKWVRFDAISNILGTGMIRSGNEQYNEAEYYYFKMNNIGNFDGKCHFENMVMVNASKEEFDRYKLEEDDFLFNTRNSKELVGKTAVVPPISQPIILNNNILKIHFLGGIAPKYINYYFLSTQGHARLSSFVTSTTNVAAIYQRQLITFNIPLPPLAEQKRIVAKLQELLPLCE